jgi:hypothetical protein
MEIEIDCDQAGNFTDKPALYYAAKGEKVTYVRFDLPGQPRNRHLRIDQRFPRAWRLVMALALTVACAAPDPADPTGQIARDEIETRAMPVGKPNWVVTASGLNTQNYRNWVRLGYLVFSPDGYTVAQRFWTWNQHDYPVPISSGDVYYCGTWTPGQNPRNNCAIKTAPGFTDDPPGLLTGTYQYDFGASTVTITWTRSTVGGTTSSVHLEELWSVDTLRPGLGRMELVSDNYSLTKGIAYGSRAALDVQSKATMAEVRASGGTFSLEGESIHKDKSSGKPVVTTWQRGGRETFNVTDWDLCDDGSCLGFVQYNAGCAVSSCCKPGDDACAKRLVATGDRRFYYMTGQFGGRRNSYEFWCECLSYEACYLANSHVKPLLQVIDDDGGFQGWVGVEVSPDRNNDGVRDLAGELYASFAMVK